MTDYEKALALWQRKHITTDAELAEALNGHSISFAYHSGKLENENITYHDTREIFEHDGVTSYTGDLRTLFEIPNGIKRRGRSTLPKRTTSPPDTTLCGGRWTRRLSRNCSSS